MNRRPRPGRRCSHSRPRCSQAPRRTCRAPATRKLPIKAQARFVPPEYFPSGPSLFPQWPAQDPVRSMWVFVGTMAVLLTPKLLAYAALLADANARRDCGGAVLAFVGLLVETIIAGLLAPVTMLIPSIGDKLDIDALLDTIDGLLLTGSRGKATAGSMSAPWLVRRAGRQWDP